jgi:GTP-binding protein
MRSKGSDGTTYLTPPHTLDIEKGMELMQEDEYLEITPESVRLRKKGLTKTDRDRIARKERGLE